MRAVKIILLCAGVLAIGFIGKRGVTFFMQADSKTKHTLRVAFPVASMSTDYEPTQISLDHEYIFLENIFSTLVEIDEHGKVHPGVAEEAEWQEDELRFKIRKNLKTVSGLPITASDVVFSLKRVLVLSGNTHGNFKDLVCPNVDMRSVKDNCPGIRHEGEEVFLRASERKPFLLKMLSALDFAIIPEQSVDPKTLAIKNYKETSGPYFVDSDDEKGNIVLRMNPNHYYASSEIAQKIQLVPIAPGESSIEAFKANRVDHITTIDAEKADHILPFASKVSDVEVHVTTKIRSLILVFTARGEKELTPEDRRLIGGKIREVFHGIYGGLPGYEQRSEFFPALGDGALSLEQQNQLQALSEEKLSSSSLKPFRLGILKKSSPEIWLKPVAEQIPEADCYVETGVPELKKDMAWEDLPHAFIASTDTGFSEDIGLISYSLNAGLLGKTKPERRDWLAHYMGLESKSDRMKELRDLHYEALASPSLVPLMASPYVAVVRKPWRMEFSEHYANNQLWRIKIN